MDPMRIADHDDIAAMRLRSASDNLEAANDALDRAIRDNAPLPYAHAQGLFISNPPDSPIAH
jgi:hypothetical protein